MSNEYSEDNLVEATAQQALEDLGLDGTDKQCGKN